MRIEIAHLENIRSHEKSTVLFAKGFNCLVGGVGCGKSSVLYAIDFALFGDPIGRSYEYLLREDAESGKITVQFTQNGRSYKITRGLKKRGTSISQDADVLKLFQDETLIADTKNEAVAEQLKAVTGWDKELFREIVWIRQEHLKELLNARPRDRQTRLDELFGLSDYEKAWSNLATYPKIYEGEKTAYQRDFDVVGIEKLGAEYNNTVEKFSNIEIELQQANKRALMTKKAAEEARLELDALEEIRTNAERLKVKEAQTRANLMNIEKTATALAQRIQEKKDKIENIKRRLAVTKNQIQKQKAELEEISISPDQPPESLNQHLATLDDKLSSMKGKQEATLKAILEDQKAVNAIPTENRCPLCLQPLTGEYRNDMLQRIQKENMERQKTASQLSQEIADAQLMRSKAYVAISKIQNTLPFIDDLQTRMNDEVTELDTLSEEFEENRLHIDELRSQLESVQTEISRLDLSNYESARTHKDQTLELFYNAQSELQTKEKEKQRLTERIDEFKERIDKAQEKIERLQKITKTIEIINNIREAYRNIQPKLRREFIKILRNFVQQVFDDLSGGEGLILNVLIDEDYTPYVKSEGGVEREISNLSGGERTLLAFAYRLGLGQLIMQSKTGHGLSMLLLDEPTESLGTEDGSIDRLAEAISRFKAIEQVIAVTHSEAFAEKADHVIRFEKEAGVSKISIER